MEKNEFSIAPFDPYQSRFMCCCGCCHVKKGTKIIGIVRLILTVLSVMLQFKNQPELNNKITIVIAALVVVGIIIFLLVGIKTENHRYLIPYLVLEGLVILYCIFMIAGAFLVYLNEDSPVVRRFYDQLMKNANFDPDDPETAYLDIRQIAFAVIFILTISTILSIWWFSVVYRCYEYFKQLVEARKNGTVAVRYSPSMNA